MEKKRTIILIIIILLFILGILFSYFYYKNKYIVSFETGTKEKLLSQYIKKNSKIKKPIASKKDGYVFVEWQYNGKNYNFEEKVTKNMVLTAKWLKEEYITVNYETNSDDIIKPQKILKGNPITNLPSPHKDNYEFVGWYINNTIYNNQSINDDITLSAHYKEIPIKLDYKIGDTVIIVGNYASSSYSTVSPHKRAIGWERTILDILDGSNYPYVIGNDYGVTGFFKEESIQKER